MNINETRPRAIETFLLNQMRILIPNKWSLGHTLMGPLTLLSRLLSPRQ